MFTVTFFVIFNNYFTKIIQNFNGYKLKVIKRFKDFLHFYFWKINTIASADTYRNTVNDARNLNLKFYFAFIFKL